MPTASTAQILGNSCFEPIMSNIYTRRILAGQYMVLNNYLVQDLMLCENVGQKKKIKLLRMMVLFKVLMKHQLF